MWFFRRPKKILIIDDNKELVVFLKKILESEHYKVFFVTQGRGALDLARLQKPDVIILDILIPDLGGEEIERILKTEPSTSNIPIIYMTALATREDEESSVNSVGKRRLLLAKPVIKERLFKAINLALSNRCS